MNVNADEQHSGQGAQSPRYPSPDFRPGTGWSSAPGAGWGSSAGNANGGPNGGQPRRNSFYSWLRRLNLPRAQDRWFGGVCGGLARRWGVDPIIIRGAFVVLALIFGIGLLIYAAAWAFLPEPDGRIHVEEVGRGNWSAGMTGAVIMAGLYVTGLWSGLAFSGFGWGIPAGLSWLIVVVGCIAAAVIIASNRSERRQSAEPAESTPTAAQSPATEPVMEGDGGQGESAAHLTEDPATEALDATARLDATETLHATEPLDAAGMPEDAAPVVDHPAGPYRPGSPTTPGGAPWREPQPRYQPRPSADRKPRAPHAAAGPMLLVVGIAALVAAAVVATVLLNLLTGIAAVLGFAAAAFILAVGIVIFALRGERSEPLGGLATLAVIAAVVVGLFGVSSRWGFATSMQESPAATSQVPGGVSIVAGHLDLDLSATRPDSRAVDVRFFAAHANVYVPNDRPVRVHFQVVAGGRQINGNDTSSSDVQLNTGSSGTPLEINVYGAAGAVDVRSK